MTTKYRLSNREYRGIVKATYKEGKLIRLNWELLKFNRNSYSLKRFSWEEFYAELREEEDLLNKKSRWKIVGKSR